MTSKGKLDVPRELAPGALLETLATTDRLVLAYSTRRDHRMLDILSWTGLPRDVVEVSGLVGYFGHLSVHRGESLCARAGR